MVTRRVTSRVTAPTARRVTGNGVSAGSDLEYVSGVLGTPNTTGTSSLNSNTWLTPEVMAIESELSEVQIASASAATVKLKVLAPGASGAFDVISDQSLSCSIGNNTFSVAAGTLSAVTIPASGAIALLGGTGARFRTTGGIGLMNIPGDVSGSTVTAPTLNSSVFGMEAKQKRTYTRSSPGQYIVNEDYSNNVLPTFARNLGTAWTFASSKATSGGTGLANALEWYYLTRTSCTFEVEFEFTGATGEFAIYRNQATASSRGTIASVDLASNELRLYAEWNGSTTLPSGDVAESITGFTLAQSTRYILRIIRDGRAITIQIEEKSSGLTFDHEYTTTAGDDRQALGSFGFASLVGTTDVFDTKVIRQVAHPDLLIMGDSVTYGSVDSDTNGAYAYQAKAGNGSGIISATGGNSSEQLRYMLRHELRLYVPRYVLIFIGINDAKSDGGKTTWETEIDNIHATIENFGATPLWCTITPTSVSADQTRIDAMNATLLAKSWQVARFDIALSVGGDGSTYNASLMGDSVHPNNAGHDALYARLQTDFPFLF